MTDVLYDKLQSPHFVLTARCQRYTMTPTVVSFIFLLNLATALLKTVEYTNIGLWRCYINIIIKILNIIYRPAFI
jgi:hypothetical protein